MNTSQRVRIIAEAGVNHNGELEQAKQLIDVAVEAGADVVKFQTFKAALSIAPGANKAGYQRRTTGGAEDQLEMVRKLELTEADHDALIAHCRGAGIEFLSTPFDTDSIELLRSRKVSTGKIPSGEVTNKPYLHAMARGFADLIMSTGMCTMNDVAAAIGVLLNAGAERGHITLLHCNTEYPTPFEDVNLRAMQAMADAFGLPVGYSDHTLGIEVPIAAVALGATVIEKHITLDRSMPGPDHRASLEPRELTAMVSAIRNIEVALGDGVKRASPSEIPNIEIARKSIHLSRNIQRGQVLTSEDLIMLRPGDGLSPMVLETVIGKRIASDLPAGRKLRLEDLG